MLYLVSYCISGPRHCCGKFGLRRAVFHGEEIVRPAHQRALRDTGTISTAAKAGTADPMR